MKWLCLLPLWLIAAIVPAQTAQSAPDMAHDPHYHLLLENSQVRAFSFKLGYNESELTRHDLAFLLVTLEDCQPAMWIEGQSPIVPGTLKQGAVNYLAGGWTRGMRNDQKSTCRFVAVEFLDPGATMNADTAYAGNTGPSVDPAGRVAPEATSIATMALGTSYVTTAYLPHGNSMPARSEDAGELLIPTAEVDLKTEDNLHIRKSAGEVEWIEAADASALENAGEAVARFVLVRFRLIGE